MNKVLNKLLKFFMAEEAQLVADMKASDHNFDKDNLNPYHLEGDVWTHTMMVMRKAEEMGYSEEVLLEALLHDVGKPASMYRNEETQRVSFKMHEQLSAFRSLDILKKLNKSESDIVRIFKAVALHTDLYRLTEKNFNKYLEKYKGQAQLVKDLKDLGNADALGRLVDETVSPQKGAVAKMNELADRLLSEMDKDCQAEIDETKPQAIVLIGLPMSGKSTFIKKIGDYEIVSRDNLVMEAGNGKSYSEAFGSVDQKKINSLLQERITGLLKEKKDVVFDMTNMSRKKRKALSNRLKESGYQVHGVVLLSGDKSLMERNHNRKEKEGKFIPQEVLNRMKKSFHPPMYDEFDSIEYFVN